MKKEERSKLYVGLFIIFLMISSTIGFLASYSSPTGEAQEGVRKSFNGHSFTYDQFGWSTYSEQTNSFWTFTYYPEELNFETTNIGQISNKVYVYMENDFFYAELSRKLALLGVVSQKIDLDEVDCNDQDNTLLFVRGDYNKIYKDNKCVYFEGNTIQSIDMLMYSLLGIL